MAPYVLNVPHSSALNHRVHSLVSLSLKLSDPPSEPSLFVIYSIVLVYLTVSSLPVFWFLCSGVIFGFCQCFIEPPLEESCVSVIIKVS